MNYPVIGLTVRKRSIELTKALVLSTICRDEPHVDVSLLCARPAREYGPVSGLHGKWKHLECYLLLTGGTACKCRVKILFPHDELHYTAG